jgi:hypothetical protein
MGRVDMKSTVRVSLNADASTDLVVLNAERRVLLEASFGTLSDTRCKLIFQAVPSVRIWRTEVLASPQGLLIPDWESRKLGGRLVLERKVNERVVALRAGEDGEIEFQVAKLNRVGVDLVIRYPSVLICCSRGDFDRFFTPEAREQAWEV